MQTQLELMGYIDITTNCKDDLRKIIVLDVYPLASKADKKEIWGYAIQTKSIGSGKTARLTVRADSYKKKPIKKFDILYASKLEKNRKGYWYLVQYEQIT